MKTLFYVSTTSEEIGASLLPVSLAKILYQSRKANIKHGISGALAFYEGNYFQALEGPEKAVDQLFSNISKDRRHRDVRVIYERETTFRLFPESPMSLVYQYDQELFVRYINAYFLDNSTRSRHALNTISKFVDVTSIYDQLEANIYKVSHFKNKNLSLSRWPRFTKSPPLALVELCVSLKQLPKSYEFHVNQNPFDTTSELDDSLKMLESKGLLIVENRPTKSALGAFKESVNSSAFYKKMRHFLSSTK